ncbi:glycosyltransferase [Methylobacterium sp. WL120]|uniref:glycosyltransferase n=1 Tax=Methylobacterium sp. WL120 TaxID=2603887 RepID=UPI0011C723E1|nr:glycosyltransferase [Methylobacterium sp. WL120]TXM64118.1 glycosyltransferase family 4 protein [Methylobacterium sp. WL120]
MNSPIYLDQTHVRGHVTGIERVALDQFTPAMLGREVRPLRSRGLPGMILAQQVGLPLRAAREPDAQFLMAGFPPGPLMAPFSKRCILCVYDTFLLDRPQDLAWKSRLYMAPAFRFAMRWGRRFLVISRQTGADLRRHCADDALVALLRPGVRDVFGLAGLPGPATFRPGAPLRLLAIGTIEPRKDYPAAIALTAALNRAGVPAELHVVGRLGWGRHAFLDDPPPFLTWHGYVGDEALRALAGSAHLLLSTSKAEGLGLPLLEIQHGGLPVVAPDDAVFREVLGESGLFIHPSDPEGSAATLIEAMRSGRLGQAATDARANVARWNRLASRDVDAFRAYLVEGASAYGPDSLVPPAAVSSEA